MPREAPSFKTVILAICVVGALAVVALTVDLFWNRPDVPAASTFTWSLWGMYLLSTCAIVAALLVVLRALRDKRHFDAIVVLLVTFPSLRAAWTWAEDRLVQQFVARTSPPAQDAQAYLPFSSGVTIETAAFLVAFLVVFGVCVRYVLLTHDRKR